MCKGGLVLELWSWFLFCFYLYPLGYLLMGLALMYLVTLMN